jgi:hypothetical protein
MGMDNQEKFSLNLLEFLKRSLSEGQNADVAINPELEQVNVFVDDDLVLAGSFDDVASGRILEPGFRSVPH